MSHITHDRPRLIARVNRLIGQLGGVRRMIEEAPEGDQRTCYEVMQQFAAARGAMDGLMRGLIEDHLETHVVRATSETERVEGAHELLRVLNSFGTHRSKA